MGYLLKSAVENGIKKRVRKDRYGKEHTDYEAYFGIDPFTKHPVRITRASREELKKVIRDFYFRHQAGGDAAVRLTATQAIDAKNALDALTAAGTGVSLTEAVRAFLDGSTRRLCDDRGVTVGKAYREYYDGKETSVTDRNKVAACVGRWVDSFGEERPLSAVTAKEVLEYLQKNFADRKPKTYNSHLLYLNTFFNWCAKEEREYLLKNPVKSLERRDEPWTEPEYLKVSEAEAIMRLVEAQKDTRPDMLAYEIVNLFCGSRDIEVMRMAEADSANRVNIEDETVRIANGKGFQQGRRPRAFHIEPTALAWMKSFDFLAALKKVTPATKNDIFKLARKNGLRVFQNFGRHTFITMHVAAYGDPAKTQAIVGTSEKMRAENYCGLASKAEGEAFFRILPKAG